MVVSIIIANFMVSKVLIDQGSSTNILYWKRFQRLEVSPGTSQPHADIRGYIDLMNTFGQGQLSRSFTISYLIVDANASYFALIGRKTLNELGAIVSTPHLKMKFPTLTEEIVNCYAKSLRVAPYPRTWESAKPHLTADDDTPDRGSKPIEELVKLQLRHKPG
ncbi:hypothetical protein AAZX31_08G247400 [Glycine max]